MRHTSCVCGDTQRAADRGTYNKRKINMYESSNIQGQVDGERDERASHSLKSLSPSFSSESFPQLP